MFLRSLTLKGFKSFAEPTTLELEPGVTVVVGPNGSGKSNVVDAVAWVLGAQGPRALRSTKMDDVIFAGSSRRPALGRAEVSLTIDNSSGLLPIGFTEVTITRVLFRASGESEYSINGVPCRLLDVQELLSDTGVGRQQHVIVSQGQLDDVLEARAESRRQIIEEAAGVLKYRRRRERAQRRLETSEANLVRLGDLLREVRRQLRPLERQAEAARRHGDLAAELLALRLHLAGREIVALRTRVETSNRTRTDHVGGETSLRDQLARIDEAVAVAEASREAFDRDDLDERIGRLRALRERARGVAALLGERQRSASKARTAVDDGLVASLVADASRLRGELDAVEGATSALEPEMVALSEAQAELDEERVRFGAAWEEGLAMAGDNAAVAEARGELAALRLGAEGARKEAADAAEAISVLDRRARQLDTTTEQLRKEIDEAAEAEEHLVAAVDATTGDLAAAQAAVEAAEAELAAVSSDQKAWAARADALTLALDEVRAAAGIQRLAEAGAAGVLGTLLELVDVDPGWEAAFEAAVGVAAAAVVIDGVEAAQAALATLRSSGSGGVGRASVLALGGHHADRSRASGIQPEFVPDGLEALRRHVHSELPELDAVMAELLKATVVVGGDWAAAIAVALAHPTLVVVTREGDRFSAAGWATGAKGQAATGSALAEATARSEDGLEAVAAARAQLDAALTVRADAIAAQAAASRRLDGHDSAMAAATQSLQRAEAEAAGVKAEKEALASLAAGVAQRLGRDNGRIVELEGILAGAAAEELAGQGRMEALSEARRHLEEQAAIVAAGRAQLQARSGGLDERRRWLEGRLEEIEARLVLQAEERSQVEARRHQAARLEMFTRALAALVTDRLALLDATLAQAVARREKRGIEARNVASHLESLRRQRAEAERELERERERVRRAELEQAEAAMRLEACVEALRRDLDSEPERAIEAPCPTLPDGQSASDRVRELERELRLLGPINPLALQEFEALEERHTFLAGQLDDVKSSRRELSKVIRAVDGEIVTRFSAAYADVAEHFEKLFETLFPGGKGRLRLSQPDDLLETGIEIEARPAGKSERRLSLLSGGERSLCALAFLFAVFRGRPSPFYLLDEVEAALDDVNLHRFLALLNEFRAEAQLLVVSHQKRTMEAADSLYGVTMAPGGSSKVVSERVRAVV